MSSFCSLLRLTDVVLRPEQAELLGAPPGEAHAVVDPGRRAQLEGGLQQGAEPLPLSLMPGPSGTLSRWAPSITTLSCRPVSVWAMRFSASRSSWKISASMDTAAPGVAASSLPMAKVVKITGIVRPGASPMGLTSAVGAAGLALVEDDHADGAGGLGVEGLDGEVTGAPLHEGDVAGHEAGEVGRLAPAGGARRGRRRQHHVDRLDGARPCRGGREVGGDEVFLGVGELVGRGALEHGEVLGELERERLALDLEARRLEATGDVVDALGVAGTAGGAVAAVAVGDALEGDEVAVGATDIDPADQPLGQPGGIGLPLRSGID